VIELIPLTGIGEVTAGDDLAALIAGGTPEPLDKDIIVLTQKVVSKAEGRFAPQADKDAQVEAESARILRRSPGGMVISETHHGFVCANAGVDISNVPGDDLVLLPVDPDASARRIRSRLQNLLGVDVAIVISDTFGRAWRIGQVDVAIGVAGISPFVDHVGRPDTNGRTMTATKICVADELASAAELVMGKTKEICAVIVRGADVAWERGAATEIVRSPGEDLFR
jgi:coenzyme F420-0:L-glutamate ligase/coenzyme F420-1:gamma-L-glutamate ligase